MIKKCFTNESGVGKTREKLDYAIKLALDFIDKNNKLKVLPELPSCQPHLDNHYVECENNPDLYYPRSVATKFRLSYYRLSEKKSSPFALSFR